MRFKNKRDKHVQQLQSWLVVFLLANYKLVNRTSLGGLEVRLNKENISKSEAWEKTTNRFYKTLRGGVIRDSSFIYAAEKDYPGVVEFYESHLWDVLKYPEANIRQVHTLMYQLPLTMVTCLFQPSNSRAKKPVRKEFKAINQLYKISRINNLDALACLLLLHRESELLIKIDALRRLKWEIYLLSSRLASFFPFGNIMDIIYRDIGENYVNKPFPLPSFIPDTPHMKRYLGISHLPYHSPDLRRESQLNSGILWAANQCGFCGKERKAQLEFLFWVNFKFNRIKIDEVIKSLPYKKVHPSDYFNLPPPLDKLMEMITGDKRSYLKPEHFYEYSFEKELNDPSLQHDAH